jgi:plastocyanin
MKPISKLALTTIMMALAACGGSSDSGIDGPPGDGKTVNATSSLRFTPATLTVSTGDAVTFAFGGVAHNVFFDARLGAPDNIPGTNANASIQRTFATAGTYTYTCHIHPSMHGSVVVQ